MRQFILFGALLSSAVAATTLYGGAQNVVLSAGLSTSCSAAFNTSLNCPASVQLLTYGNAAVGRLLILQMNNCKEAG